MEKWTSSGFKDQAAFILPSKLIGFPNGLVGHGGGDLAVGVRSSRWAVLPPPRMPSGRAPSGRVKCREEQCPLRFAKFITPSRSAYQPRVTSSAFALLRSRRSSPLPLLSPCRSSARRACGWLSVICPPCAGPWGSSLECQWSGCDEVITREPLANVCRDPGLSDPPGIGQNFAQPRGMGTRGRRLRPGGVHLPAFTRDAATANTPWIYRTDSHSRDPTRFIL